MLLDQYDFKISGKQMPDGTIMDIFLNCVCNSKKRPSKIKFKGNKRNRKGIMGEIKFKGNRKDRKGIISTWVSAFQTMARAVNHKMKGSFCNRFLLKAPVSHSKIQYWFSLCHLFPFQFVCRFACTETQWLNHIKTTALQQHER